VARCRTCREEIEFAKLKNGKMCPVVSATPERYRLRTDASMRQWGRPTGKLLRLVVDGVILDGVDDPHGAPVDGCEVHICASSH
jgi:hypothetical protein